MNRPDFAAGLQPLRGWSDKYSDTMLREARRASGADAVHASARAWLAMGRHRFDCPQDRLHGTNACNWIPTARSKRRSKRKRCFPKRPACSAFHIGTTLAPTGQILAVEHTEACFTLNLISAASQYDESRSACCPGILMTVKLIDFLKRLMIHRDTPVRDRHPVHSPRAVKKLVARTQCQLRLLH